MESSDDPANLRVQSSDKKKVFFSVRFRLPGSGAENSLWVVFLTNNAKWLTNYITAPHESSKTCHKH